MVGRVRVLVYVNSPPAGGSGLQDAYHAVSRSLTGVPGLIGNQLMRSELDPGRLVVMSEWADRAAFSSWEQGPQHRDVTAPLRPFQDPERTPPFGIYRVVAAYSGDDGT